MIKFNGEQLILHVGESLDMTVKDFGAEIIDKETIRFYKDGVYRVIVSDGKITIYKKGQDDG